MTSSNLTVLGNKLFYTAGNPSFGTELFVHDPSISSAPLIIDIVPGVSSSSPSNLLEFQGYIYFTAFTASEGAELWRSDGTALGTTLFKDIRTGVTSSLATPIAKLGTLMILSATDGTSGTELWKSDGTAAGTVLLSDLTPGSGSSTFISNASSFTHKAEVINSNLLFVASANGSGIEIWSTDGTTAQLLIDANPGSGDSTPQSIVSALDIGFFTASPGGGSVKELYRTDGTPSGTYQVAPTASGTLGSFPGRGVYLNGNFIYASIWDQFGYEPTYISIDGDNDGIRDELDGCPTDPAKISPGFCGCGTADIDADLDSAYSCIDECDNDPDKVSAGICGCGIEDTDSDSDGTSDCNDACLLDPLKIIAGTCGCGIADVDSDADSSADCVESCDNDPAKASPGICGCGIADTDSDGDGSADCIDACDADPAKTSVGICGCGTADADSDMDGIPDCNDGCPVNSAELTPGSCGCGVIELDNNQNGVFDCLLGDDVKATLNLTRTELSKLKNPNKPSQNAAFRARKNTIKKYWSTASRLLTNPSLPLTPPKTRHQLDLSKKKVNRLIKTLTSKSNSIVDLAARKNALRTLLVIRGYIR